MAHVCQRSSDGVVTVREEALLIRGGARLVTMIIDPLNHQHRWISWTRNSRWGRRRWAPCSRPLEGVVQTTQQLVDPRLLLLAKSRHQLVHEVLVGRYNLLEKPPTLLGEVQTVGPPLLAPRNEPPPPHLIHQVADVALADEQRGTQLLLPAPLRSPHMRQHVELGVVQAISPEVLGRRPFHLLDDPPHPQPRQDRVPPQATPSTYGLSLHSHCNREFNVKLAIHQPEFEPTEQREGGQSHEWSLLAFRSGLFRNSG